MSSVVKKILLSIFSWNILNYQCYCNASKIITDTKIVKRDVLKYWYDADASSQCDIVLIMCVGAVLTPGTILVYDTMARYIVEDSSVVYIATDHAPGSIYQVHEEGYAKFADAIASDITNIVPACSRSPPIGFIVGGHSSGALAAIQALAYKDFKAFEPIGIIGIDPYPGAWIGSKQDEPQESIPGMFWGFTHQSCYLYNDLAAKSSYVQISRRNRVLYLADNSKNPRVGHCLFVDGGCVPLCPTAPVRFLELLKAFTDTVHIFIAAILTDDFSNRNDFVIETPPQVPDLELYFGLDNPYLPL
jgi:hypothetical protein